MSSSKKIEVKFPTTLIPLKDYHDGLWLANALTDLLGQEVEDKEIAFKDGYYWFQFDIK